MKNTPEKLLVSTLMGLSVLMPGVQVVSAYAEPLQNEQQSVMKPTSFDVDTSGLADNDELFAQYVDRAFGLGGSRRRLLAVQRDGRLTEKERKIYDVLKSGIEKIASGDISDTRITVPFVTVFGKNGITAADIGVDKITDDDLGAYLFTKTNVSHVIQALVLDLPYDLYWFDKTTSGRIDIAGGSYTDKVFSYNDSAGYVFNLTVAQDYRGANDFTTNLTKTKATADAVRRAKKIINDAASKSDWEKLKYYKEQICNLTSYNREVANASSPAYGDPWQLIYVFDGNTTTNVVCEGYAKAFKYLCDNTTFSSDRIEVYLMSGTMSGGTGAGDHMWNVVRMDDGKNYLVDLTNCDEGTIGASDQLFFKGCNKTNTVAKDYTMMCKGGNVQYVYDNATMAAYTDEERTLSTTDYTPNNYSVTIVAGAHMSKTAGSGEAKQTNLSGAMTDVVYTADTGYYFPTSYKDVGQNGITVTRNSATKITVSGVPTAHTTINLPDATAKQKEKKPAATFTATGTNTGTLTNVANGMQYRVGNSDTWKDITSTSVTISGLSNGSSIQVRRPAGDMTLASDTQTIEVSKAQAPTNSAARDCKTIANNDGEITGVSSQIEYRASETSGWISATGSTITGLQPGTYEVRTKATGTTLASEPVTRTIKRFISYKVIFQVENGAWNNGNSTSQTVPLTGHEGDKLTLVAGQIPAVGNKPADGYKAGSWEVVPTAGVEITSDTTYTYTYAKRTSISATVTFQVVGGSWDDGSTGPKSRTVTGFEDDKLTLDAGDIPAVGNKPADGYKEGGWNVDPTTDVEVTDGMVYTYAYARKTPISATVTFRVVNGTWDDGTTADIPVLLTGLEGDTLRLRDDDIPAVGNRPDGAYKAGDWDIEPAAGDDVTGGKTYTYTYKAKDPISATVTFRVVNGTWDDGTSADIPVLLTGLEGDTLRLGDDDIPAVGSMPADGYGQGVWDVTPVAGATISGNKTYTYTYVNDNSRTAEVIFRVFNGSWDDGSSDEVIARITGSKDEALTLTSGQIPAVGNKPLDGFKAGGWDVTPTVGDDVTGGKTYTYTYAAKTKIGRTVTFKVVGGAWNDGTTDDKPVPLSGYEDETLMLKEGDIPAVGGKPDRAHKASGGWDVTPIAGAEVTDDATYTYTYDERKQISATVFFLVENGAWNNGDTNPKTVTLTGYEGDTLSLEEKDIPEVGNSPDGAHKEGEWAVMPTVGATFADGSTYTYTYTYAEKAPASATVTFKVVGGFWDKGGADPWSRIVTGYEDEALRLKEDDIPAVGGSPDRTHKAGGGWDVVPTVGDDVTDGKTYTYTYAKKTKIGRTVTFKVVGGAWNDGTTDDKPVPLSGYEDETLELRADQIPAVGKYPSRGYTVGSWDTEPMVGAVTTDVKYTYTYAKELPAAPAPIVKTGLVVDGTPLQLIEPMYPAAGMMQYALGTSGTTPPENGWSTSIPTGTEAGKYFVWYRSVDNSGSVVTKPGCVTVSIAGENDPTPAPTPTPTHTPTSTTSYVPTPRRVLAPFFSDWSVGTFFGRDSGRSTNYNTSIATSSTTTSTTTSSNTKNTGSATRASRATVERLAGADRYGTMSAVVDEAFPSADFVAVASGQNFADALVSAPLAGIKGAPILITKQNLLQRDATAEVDRLKPSGAYIVGGPEAVTERAEEALRQSGSGNTAVTRVAGKNRQATSVAALHEARKAGSKSDTIIVVNGHDFADALSISSWAYATKSPMLLTTADGRLTQEEVDAIKADKFVKRIILVGGTSAVSDAVRSQLASDLAVERVGGANRYETSRKVAEFSVANGMSWSTVAVVTGRDYSDGLVAAALVGKNKGVLLLVDGTDGPAIAAIRENAGKLSKLYVLGGEGAVSAPVESAVRTAVAG